MAPVAASVSHPGTTGKNEHGHKTAQRWLSKQPTAGDLIELQQLLDTYRNWYNHRRHQALAGLTPQQRWDLAERARPDGTPIPAPPIITRPTVSPRGAISVDGHEIGLAKRHAGASTVVFRSGDHVTVFIAAEHIRTLDLDRTRDYQPSGIKPPGGPRRKA